MYVKSYADCDGSPATRKWKARENTGVKINRACGITRD